MAADEFDDGELGSEIDDPPEDLEDAIDELLETDLMGDFSTELANLLYRLREDGAGGGLDGNFEPGEAVVYAGDGEYVSEPIEITRETTVYEAGESDTIDVSEIATTETFVLTGASGGSGNGNDAGSGGAGAEVECRIDLSNVDEIEIEVADGRIGHTDGESGEDGQDPVGRGNSDGGSGGGSSAILADGEIVIEAGGGGGGGGGTPSGSSSTPGGDGGDGSPPIGGSGGNGETDNDSATSGENGDYEIYDTNIVTHVSDGHGGGAEVRVFD